MRYWAGGGNVVGLLVGSGAESKTPAAGCSRELWPIGTHWEAEGGRVGEGLGWWTGWCCKPVDSAWKDSFVHATHGVAHCVGACHCMLVVLTWASMCCAGVVVVQVAAMCEAVVPVLKMFYRQGGEATWGVVHA